MILFISGAIFWIRPQGLCLALAIGLELVGARALPAQEPVPDWQPGTRTTWLLRELDQANLPARRAAAWRLGRLGPAAKPALEPLASALRSDDPELRWASAWALTRIGPDAVPALARALDDSPVSTQRAAAYALLRLSPHSSAALAKLLSQAGSPEPFLQGLAIRASELLSPAQSELAGALLSHPEVRVRTRALAKLASFGPAAAAAVPAIRALLKGPVTNENLAALRALAAIGPGAQPASAEVVAYLSGLRYPQQGAEILASIKAPAAVANPYLLERVRGYDPNDRAQQGPRGVTTAFLVLAQLNHEVPMELTSWINDQNPRVRTAGWAALKAFGPRAASFAERLDAGLNDPNHNVVAEVRQVAIALGPQAASAIPALVASIPQQANYWHALDALVSIGAPAAPDLLRFLEHNHAYVRLFTLRSLAQSRDNMRPAADSLIPVLRKLIKEDGKEIKHAILALGALGPAAAPVLLESFEPGDRLHRFGREKWQALYRIGPLTPDALALRETLRTVAAETTFVDAALEPALDSGHFTERDLQDYLAEPSWSEIHEARWKRLAERAAPQIVAALADERPAVRRRAVTVARSLDPAKHPEFVRPLSLALLDLDRNVAEEAKLTLPHWGPEAALAVARFLGKSDEATDYRVLEVLEALGPIAPESEKILREFAMTARPSPAQVRLWSVTLNTIEPVEGYSLDALPELFEAARGGPQAAFPKNATDLRHLADLGPPAGPLIQQRLAEEMTPLATKQLLERMVARQGVWPGCWEELRPALERLAANPPARLGDAIARLAKRALGEPPAK